MHTGDRRYLTTTLFRQPAQVLAPLRQNPILLRGMRGLGDWGALRVCVCACRTRERTSARCAFLSDCTPSESSFPPPFVPPSGHPHICLSGCIGSAAIVSATHTTHNHTASADTADNTAAADTTLFHSLFSS
eukprot:1227708-Pleurochrysis_carterae.AAC.5